MPIYLMDEEPPTSPDAVISAQSKEARTYIKVLFRRNMLEASRLRT
jgi:hypothetical protein